MSTSTPDASSFAGTYEIRRLLGEGGSAQVFLAEHRRLKRLCALKIFDRTGLPPEESRRFLGEARVLASLSHPAIVPLWDYGEHEDRLYLATPFLSGGSLLRRFKAAGRVEPIQALRWSVRLASALEVVHQAGIVHRDLKPANILLDEEDQPVVIDFGVVRARSLLSLRTEAGVILGTAEYMAPETLRGEEPGPLADIFALGLILYELLTARMVRDNLPPELSAEDLRWLATGPPLPSVREVDPALPEVLDIVIRRITAAAPGDRPGSAGELKEELTKVLRRLETEQGRSVARTLDGAWPARSQVDLPSVHGGGAAPRSPAGRHPPTPAPESPASTPEHPAAPSRRDLRPWVSPVLGALGGAALGVGVLLALPRDRPPPPLPQVRSTPAPAPSLSLDDELRAVLKLLATVPGREPSLTVEALDRVLDLVLVAYPQYLPELRKFLDSRWRAYPPPRQHELARARLELELRAHDWKEAGIWLKRVPPAHPRHAELAGRLEQGSLAFFPYTPVLGSPRVEWRQDRATVEVHVDPPVRIRIFIGHTDPLRLLGTVAAGRSRVSFSGLGKIGPGTRIRAVVDEVPFVYAAVDGAAGRPGP